MKIGYQGNHGTYSEIAALRYFSGRSITRIGYPNFMEIMQDVEKGELDYAVVPVENTTTGIIARCYDLFNQFHVYAHGEIHVAIDENLIVVPGTTIDQIEKVYSHPEALSQCQGFFRQYPHIQQVPYQDTAKSVALIKEKNDPRLAAIGSELAAEYYGLTSLLTKIQDSHNNMTRFLVISNQSTYAKDVNKMSLMFVLRHTPGSLYNAIGMFAKRHMNIVKLESRPILDQPFQYRFYVDVEANIHSYDVKEVLKELQLHCLELKIFGAYQKCK